MKIIDISDIKRIFSKNIDNIVSHSDCGSYNHCLDYNNNHFVIRETRGSIRNLSIKKKGFLNIFSGVEISSDEIDVHSFRDIFRELRLKREGKYREEKIEKIKEVMK